MTDETEACMSGWDVPQSEIDRLARLIDPSIRDEVGGNVNYVLRRASKMRAATAVVERSLTELAENPPQCAVEAMAIASTAVWLREGVWDCMEDDARALWRKGARPAFTAAINAIRGEK